jgi:multisubunit Na+/H+ antiporter MnhG subunit
MMDIPTSAQTTVGIVFACISVIILIAAIDEMARSFLWHMFVWLFAPIGLIIGLGWIFALAWANLQ